MANTKLTPLRLTDADLAELDGLAELIGASNRTEAVRQAVRWYRGYMQSQYDRLKAHHDGKRAVKKSSKKSGINP